MCDYWHLETDHRRRGDYNFSVCIEFVEVYKFIDFCFITTYTSSPPLLSYERIRTEFKITRQLLIEYPRNLRDELFKKRAKVIPSSRVRESQRVRISVE